MAGENRIYRAVLASGGINNYPNVAGYLTACRQIIGRTLTDSEKETLVDKGHLLSLGSW
jgi:hypothetical protein